MDDVQYCNSYRFYYTCIWRLKLFFLLAFRNRISFRPLNRFRLNTFNLKNGKYISDRRSPVHEIMLPWGKPEFRRTALCAPCFRFRQQRRLVTLEKFLHFASHWYNVIEKLTCHISSVKGSSCFAVPWRLTLPGKYWMC